jgi:hypothetical protein
MKENSLTMSRRKFLSESLLKVSTALLPVSAFGVGDSLGRVVTSQEKNDDERGSPPASLKEIKSDVKDSAEAVWDPHRGKVEVGIFLLGMGSAFAALALSEKNEGTTPQE